MKLMSYVFCLFFRDLDRPIARLQGVRDSYRLLNVNIYHEEMARAQRLTGGLSL